MKIDFSYGYKKVAIDIPYKSFAGSIDLPQMPVCDKPKEAVSKALSTPLGTPRLRNIATNKQSAVVMIPDRTRRLPLDIILPAVLDELQIGGIKRENIKIIIGLGTHRPMTVEEINLSVGEEIANQYEIINHAWWDHNQLKEIGPTSNNIPIEINKIVYESEVKVAIGSVKPHRVAGWSGGAKMIQPGVCGAKTSGAVHWIAAQCATEEILGNANNPIRKEMEEIAQKVGLDFIVN